jgi:TPP-dependent pyruvate/acetoin dehydrogenase alpha subunit
MNLDAVAEVVQEAADRARRGDGPTLIEAHTYRFSGHMPGDPEVYRTAKEVEGWRSRDPLTLYRARLVQEGIAEEEIVAVEQEVRLELDAALADAEAAPEPLLEELALGTSEWMETTR